MAGQNAETPQIAVWYFIAATFVFAASTTFLRSDVLWITIASVAVGFVLIALGGWQLGRELQARRAARERPDD
jgi:Kef-type K+ transport system membrane component KefB